MSQHTAIPAEELEAALIEGLIPIDDNPELIQLVGTYKERRRLEGADRKSKSKAGTKLMGHLTKMHAAAFTIAGVVQVRKQITNPSVGFDENKFRIEHPKLHQKYMTKVQSGGTRIWVRPQDGDDATE